jgi:Domain of unknown function DUF87.
MLKQAIEASALAEAKKVQLAMYPHAQNTSVAIDPAHLFGRHCAVLGATGGGKSWAIAHLIEEIARLGSIGFQNAELEAHQSQRRIIQPDTTKLTEL